MAKRQISLWTDKEKSAFMEAYKVNTRPLSFQFKQGRGEDAYGVPLGYIVCSINYYTLQRPPFKSDMGMQALADEKDSLTAAVWPGLGQAGCSSTE